MKTTLSRFFSERARLFLLSLAIAVTLWLYVSTTTRAPQEQSPTATLRLNNVAVTFAGVAAGWQAAAVPDTVDVEMRWPAEAEGVAVRPAEVRAIADVNKLPAGRHEVKLTFQQLPSGVTSVKAIPQTVTVTLSSP